MSWQHVKVKGKKPCGRYGHTEAVVGKFIFIFGGFDGTSQLNDTNVLKRQTDRSSTIGFTFQWKQPLLRGDPPQARYGHSASVVGDQIFIFGGNTGNNKRLNDIHILATSSLTWTATLINGTPPAERSGHTASVIKNKIFIFGGYSNGVWLNDLHVFNTTTSTWSTPSCTGISPSGRNYHTASVVGSDIYFFGGFGNDIWLNDMHILSTDTFTWQTIKPRDNPPLQLSDHVAFVVGKNVFVCGGYCAKRQLNDLNIYDTEKQAWYLPVLNGIAPCSRNYHTGSVLDNQVIIFGGYDGNKSLNDVHVLDLDGVEAIKKKHDIEMKFDEVCDQLQSVLENARKDLREAFQADIRNQRDHLAAERRLMQEQMESLQEEVKREKLVLKKEKKIMKEVKRSQKNRVKLNIGGHKFETSITTLTKYQDSMFGAMFSGRHSVEPDEDGYYFIDRDGTHFIYILNYLRDGSLNFPYDTLIFKWLINEAKFYSLASLVDVIKKLFKEKTKNK